MEQMCTAVFAFLESAKPFFQYGKPLQELLPFFVRALGGILPLDALAIVRMEGKKGVCETACWSGTPHLPEALMLRAFNGKEFPKAFDTPFSEEALAALFPEETAGKLNWLALPIACDGLCAPCSGFSSREKHIANSNRFISACSTRRWIR